MGSTAERIADAAEQILRHEGAAAVSMRRVADAVGITPMAIYRHYPNRDAVLAAVADAAMAELGAQWRHRHQDPDLDRRISALLQDFLDFALGAPHLYRFAMIDRRRHALSFPDDHARDASPAFTPILTAVREGVRSGWLRDGDPLEITFTLTSLAQGMVQQYHAGRVDLDEPEFRALCARSVRRALDGLRPHGPDSTTR